MKEQAKQPNILLFFSDQHAYSYMGNAGNRLINTPALDKLAAEGVSFDNAYCQNPLCLPSRASMMAGRYSRNIGIYDNLHIMGQNEITLPYALGHGGYKTCLIGKNHYNGEQFQGFQQRPYGDLYGGAHQSEFIRNFEYDPDNENGLGDLMLNSGPTEIPLPLTQTEICVSESAKWLQTYLDTGDARPFFLSVNFEKPHFPFRCPAMYFDKYADRAELPVYREDYLSEYAVQFVQEFFYSRGGPEYANKNAEERRKALAAYCGCVEWIDDAIGRILDSLRYLGLEENTIVIYSSDHGEMAGVKGLWRKSLFFDQSCKVPLIIKLPGVYMAGARTGIPAGLVDLFPTLCEEAGIQNIPCDGVSLSSLLRGGEAPGRDAVFAESVLPGLPEQAGCMIRTKRYKYNLYLAGRNELYDMEEDPSEECNLSGLPSYANLEAGLAARAADFWEPGKQLTRFFKTPVFPREKSFYPHSNQFITSCGTVVNARP